MSTIKDLNDQYLKLDKLYNEYGLDNLGRNIKDYIVPDRGRFSGSSSNPRDRNSFDKNDRKYIIEDTGEQAANFLVGGFMSMLTPSTSPWFRLRPANEELAQIKRVGEWYDRVSKAVLDIFNEADVYNVLYSTYLEFITFGTAAQLIESDELEVIRPVSFTFGEYRISTDGRNKPNTFAMQVYMYAHELASRFGKDSLSGNARRALDNNEPTLFKVRWLVTANDGSIIPKRGDAEFVGMYWEVDRKGTDDSALEVKGFDEFPFQIARYSTISNDTYGKESPGQKQLANIKMLQSMTEDYVIAIKREGDPPMVSDGNHSMINTLPGGLTEAPNSLGSSISVRPMFERAANFPAIRDGIEYWKQIINEGFFTHLLLIISGADNDRKTATEIIARNEEKYGFLGSVLNRVFKEVLKPMIERTISIMARQGFFDEPIINEFGEQVNPEATMPMPPELVDEEYDINFTSLLAQAQEAIGLNQLDRFIERISMVAQIKPEILDKLDSDAIAELYGKTVPTRTMLDSDQVEETRAIQEQQNAMAEQMAMMESSSDSISKLASADTSGQNALTDLEAAEGQ